MIRVRPVLFNTGMVQAIMREEYSKTETRRCVKGYIPKDAIWGYTAFTPNGYISCRGTFKDGYGEEFFKLPCQKGDCLYIRETWAFIPCIECNGDYARPGAGMNCYDTQAVEYDDGDSISDGCFVYRAGCKKPEKITWSPSIHMPKAAARIWLKVKNVQAGHLQEMTLDDFLNEGIVLPPEAFNDPANAYLQARNQFIGIWDSTIPRGQQALYGWDADPWVWVIEFERCRKPE